MNELMNEIMKKTIIIPVMYMIFYLFKGKKEKISDFFDAFLNSWALYFNACLILGIVNAFLEKSTVMTFGMKIIILLITIIFSIPFLSVLVKYLEEDFDYYIFIGEKKQILAILGYIGLSAAILIIEIFCIYVFSIEKIGIEILLVGICFLFVLVFIIKKRLKKLVKYELKISDNFIKLGMMFSIFAIALLIFLL